VQAVETVCHPRGTPRPPPSRRLRLLPRIRRHGAPGLLCHMNARRRPMRLMRPMNPMGVMPYVRGEARCDMMKPPETTSAPRHPPGENRSERCPYLTLRRPPPGVDIDPLSRGT
jgi:hypothetical protein